MSRLIHVLVVCLLIGGCATTAEPARSPREFFVAPAGDDLATGDAATTALRTIGRAVELALPGDTVFVLPGTYGEALVIDGARSITVMGINGLPVLDGAGVAAPAITCVGCDDVTVSCLDVRGYESGVVATGSSHLAIHDLVLSDIRHDAVTISDSTDVRVEWLEMTRIGGSAVRLEGVAGGRIANNRVTGAGADAYVLHGTDIEAERNEVLG